MIEKILNGMLRGKKTKTRSALGVAAAAFAAKLPQKALEVAYGKLTTKLTIAEESRYFSAICNELQKNAMDLSPSSVMVGYGNTPTIGYGTTWSRLGKHIVMVSRDDGEKKKSKVEITFFLIKKEEAIEVVSNIIKNVNRRDDVQEVKRVDIYSTNSGTLEFVKSDVVRTRDSVFIDREILDYIDRRVDEFLARQSWYEERGIPYKYAILLHGNPGTGKSTIAKYIAGRIDRALMVVNPIEFNKYSRHLYGNVALMEDMDCDMFMNVDRGAEGNGNPMFSLGELLNSIDGVNSVTDCVIIGTTNHKEKIDPALLRKGRFDDVIEVLPLSTAEAIRMINFFFDPQEPLKGFAKEYRPITGAVLQDMIMNHLNEGPEALIKQFNKTHKIS